MVTFKRNSAFPAASLHTDFFRRQEQEVVLTSIVGADDWDGPQENSEVASVTLRGIVKAPGAWSSDSWEASGNTTAAAVLFFPLRDATTVARFKLGDEALIDGLAYKVQRVDARGVLPCRYPVRVEVTRKY